MFWAQTTLGGRSALGKTEAARPKNGDPPQGEVKLRPPPRWALRAKRSQLQK